MNISSNMERKLLTTLIASLCMVAAQSPHVLAAVIDENTIQAETEKHDKRKRELYQQYKGDPIKLAAELTKLSKEYAISLGQEDVIKQSDALHEKYGYPSSVVMELGQIPRTTDYGAWHYAFTTKNGVTSLRFFLDSRYKNATPITLTVQLRSKGKTQVEERAISDGANSPDTVRLPLVSVIDENKAYNVQFALPATLRNDLRIQIDGDFEPAWGTRLIIDCAEIKIQ